MVIAQTKSEEKEYFHVIQNKIHLLNELSQQLSLSYQTSDSVPIHIERVNCHEWPQSFMRAVSMDCHAKGIKIETSYKVSSSGYTYMDIDIHRALQNILDNAYRYTIEILELSVTNQDDVLFITIKNDGAEINKSSLGQIIQRFYTNNQHNADGHLGLVILIILTAVLLVAVNVTYKKLLFDEFRNMENPKGNQDKVKLH